MSEVLPRPAPPELQISNPDCPLCREELIHDITDWWCETCTASWPLDGGKGTWEAPDSEQCTATCGWKGETVRCVLAQDHDLEWHIHPERGEWDPEPVTDDPGDGLRSKIIGACVITASTVAMLHQELGEFVRWVL